MGNSMLAIEKELIKLFNSRLGIPKIFWNKKRRSMNLLGKEIGFLPSFLLYLFFYIEEEFEITIPQDEIVSGRFNSFKNIFDVIQTQVNKKNLQRIIQIK